jgi:hypothetical protein
MSSIVPDDGNEYGFRYKFEEEEEAKQAGQRPNSRKAMGLLLMSIHKDLFLLTGPFK